MGPLHLHPHTQPQPSEKERKKKGRTLLASRGTALCSGARTLISKTDNRHPLRCLGASDTQKCWKKKGGHGKLSRVKNTRERERQRERDRDRERQRQRGREGDETDDDDRQTETERDRDRDREEGKVMRERKLLVYQYYLSIRIFSLEDW